MEAALQATKGEGASLEGVRVAMQGCGQVGYPAVQFLLDKGAAFVKASEFNPARFEQV